jgi:3-oxoacyl-[acyl-carrier-protein] synthase II
VPTKIVVSGYGLVTPLGENAASSWSTLCPGQMNQPGASFALGKRRNISGLVRAKELALASTKEALSHANLWDGQTLRDVDPDRVGCTFSASKPLFELDTPQSPDLINEVISRTFGLRGERRNVIAACATGAYSIALGASWIEQGLCDVVVAGSVEPYPHPLIEAGFRQMGVISEDGMTRPFDRWRTGFTFGEGAGVVVLESESSARRRSIQPLAHLSGWGLGADCHSPYAFNSNGAKISGVIERALKRSGLSPENIDHVHAHGTATRLNDWLETQVLLKTFGPHAPHLQISATKASTGHLLGASASVEFILTVMALLHQYVPPTATLEVPDPECPLDYTPGHGHVASLDHALSLSYGFGGSIAALTVSRP